MYVVYNLNIFIYNMFKNNVIKKLLNIDILEMNKCWL